MKFLEVSHLSFISDLGDKHKEGLIKKRSFNINFCSSALNLSFFWDNRWLILKDTFVGYLDIKTGQIKSILLVDQDFKVSSGYQSTGERYGLFIENLSRLDTKDKKYLTALSFFSKFEFFEGTFLSNATTKNVPTSGVCRCLK